MLPLFLLYDLTSEILQACKEDLDIARARVQSN